MKFKNSEDYQVGDIIISAQKIEERLDEIAGELAKDYKNKQLLLVGLLTGATWVTIDLLERLHGLGITDVELTFITIGSYYKGTTATHEPRIESDIVINPQGRTILLVDDIADTGKTLVAVTALLKGRQVEEVKSFVLLDKPSRREVSYRPDYCGFEIPNIWVQGRGMDSDGYGRGDPHIRKGPYQY